MGWEEAAAHLDALGVDVMKSMGPALHRIEALCELLNHPERSAPALHITGTNGKTSTAGTATGLLSAMGLSVGTYTSPHLETVRERLALNGEPVSEAAFGEVFDYLYPYLELLERDLGERLTFFEVLTGMFFLWAAETPVDAMVVEVGLGGRWDATNVVPASVSVITGIGLDHTAQLGSDKAGIASEKSGIIKPGAVAVTGERSPQMLAVIEDRAAREGATVLLLERDFSVTENRVSVGGRVVSVTTTSAAYDELYLPLHGRHQGVNAAIALQAVTSFLPGRELGYEVASEGFAKAVVPGRLETIPMGVEAAATVLLDVAHNPDGISALVSSLAGTFTFDRVVFVLGVSEDKDYIGMITELGRLRCSIVATRAESRSSIPPSSIAEAAQGLGLPCAIVEGVGAATAAARADAEVDDLVCITGSHYVVGEARRFLLEH